MAAFPQMAEEWETKADVAFLPKAEGSKAGCLLGWGRLWVIMKTFLLGSWYQHRLRLCTEPNNVRGRDAQRMGSKLFQRTLHGNAQINGIKLWLSKSYV